MRAFRCWPLDIAELECILTMGSSSRRNRNSGFEWNAIYSVPEDLDTLEEEESVNSLTIHGASYRKLRLLNNSE